MTFKSSTGIKKCGTTHCTTLIKYEVSQGWMGRLYYGKTLKCEYAEVLLDIPMPYYVNDALHKFWNPIKTRPQHYPLQCTSPNYGLTTPQMAQQTEKSPYLNTSESNTVQKVVEGIFHYARAVNSTIIVTLNIIATENTEITQAREKKVMPLLNYEVTHP